MRYEKREEGNGRRRSWWERWSDKEAPVTQRKGSHFARSRVGTAKARSKTLQSKHGRRDEAIASPPGIDFRLWPRTRRRLASLRLSKMFGRSGGLGRGSEIRVLLVHESRIAIVSASGA